MSLPALRISGDYLLIASIGFQLGMIELIKNLRFTGGASGVANIPAFLVPSYGRFAYVLLVICVAVVVVLLVRWIATYMLVSAPCVMTRSHLRSSAGTQSG